MLNTTLKKVGTISTANVEKVNSVFSNEISNDVKKTEIEYQINKKYIMKRIEKKYYRNKMIDIQIIKNYGFLY